MYDIFSGHVFSTYTTTASNYVYNILKFLISLYPIIRKKIESYLLCRNRLTLTIRLVFPQVSII